MGDNEHGKQGRFVGHSKEFSIHKALEDAVAQAGKAQGGVADAMIEFEVVQVRGRAGGIAGFRDVWVEIDVKGGAPSTRALGEEGGDAGKPDATTLAVGEEGGDGPMTTLAVGEEGGDAGKPGKPGGGGDDGKYTTMALGEEGGEAAS